MPTSPTSTTAPTNLPTRAEMWLLIGIAAIGLLARVPRLLESLWYDEIAGLAYARLGPWAAATTYTDPVNHVAHTLLACLSVRGLGGAGLDVDLALRVPALGFSLGTILVLFMLADLVGGRRVAFIAAMLGAVAPVMVLEGAEARGYSMMMFFAVAATRQLLIARTGRAWFPWCSYALLCAIGIWSHLLTVCVPLGHAAWVLVTTIGAGIRGGDRARHKAIALQAATGFGLAAALTLGLYAPILGDLATMRSTIAGTGGGPGLLGPEGWHLILQLGGSWAPWAAAPGLLLALIGLVSLGRRAAARDAVIALLAPLVVFIILVLATGTWMYARFALFAVPGGLLLAALGVDELWRRRTALGVAALGVLIVAGAADLITRPPKQPLRDAAAWVAQQRGPDDPVLVIGLWHQVMDAYSGAFDMEHSRRHGTDLEAQLATVRPRWVIVLYPESVPDERYALLERAGFEVVQRFDGWVDWTNGDVVIYGRRARGP